MPVVPCQTHPQRETAVIDEHIIKRAMPTWHELLKKLGASGMEREKSQK
jgi:hypothetical protein